MTTQEVRNVSITDEQFEALAIPFPAAEVMWKPQATTRDKTRGLAVAYVDPRHYYDRLNEVFAGQWSDQYDVHIVDGNSSKVFVVCNLTINGVTRSGDGEESLGDKNAMTSASAQAFKRACVKFGLGAYLYRLPKQWAEYDERRKKFTKAALGNLLRIAAKPLEYLQSDAEQESGATPQTAPESAEKPQAPAASKKHKQAPPAPAASGNGNGSIQSWGELYSAAAELDNPTFQGPTNVKNFLISELGQDFVDNYTFDQMLATIQKAA